MRTRASSFTILKVVKMLDLIVPDRHRLQKRGRGSVICEPLMYQDDPGRLVGAPLIQI
jgi:hypothetical protein